MYSTPERSIEVETRFYFDSEKEVFTRLPWMEEFFTQRGRWKTTHFGLSLFKQDIILRISEVYFPTGTRSYLGWKSPDSGEFANIREEIDEEITNGITESKILSLVGGETDSVSPSAVRETLIRLKHPPFMEFNGENRFGFYEPLSLHLKLSQCPILPFPILMEIEKTAYNPGEARAREKELQEFARTYHLEDRVVHDEPPTLLYKATR